MTVTAVVLAAGEATRFGGPKQALLLPAVLERLLQSRVDDIVVVEGAYALDVPGDAARVVRCPEWESGPGRTLRCGLTALEPEVEAAVVVLADGPHLAPEAVARVLDAWRAGGGIVAASYEGARGHPLVVGRADWGDIPNGGLHERPALLVPCDDLGSPGDVDTPEDL